MLLSLTICRLNYLFHKDMKLQNNALDERKAPYSVHSTLLLTEVNWG